MKAKKRMLAFVLALSLTVTSFAGWTSQSDNTADVKASASVSDVSSVSSVSLSAPLTLSTDLEYVGSTSALNTIRLRLDGSTFKEGISKSDIRLDNAFKEMSVKGVSSDGDTVTLTLKGTPVKNEQVNIYEPGKVVVLASGINGAKDYVQVDIPVMSPYLGFDPESIKAEGEKITADIIAYDIGDINAITKDNVTVEGVKVIAAEKKNYKTVAVTFEADGVKTVNDFAALVNGKKITVNGKESEVYLPGVSLAGYLDYCEQNGENLDITLDLYANCGKFADKITTDMVSFGEQFKDAKAQSIEMNDGTAKLKLSVPANGKTPENFDLYGEVKLSADAFVNDWGEKPAAAVSEKHFYTGSSMERDIAYKPSGTLDAQTLLDIQKYTRGLDTNFGTVLYWGSTIGGGLSTAYSIISSILQMTGVIESEHAQVMKALKQIMEKIDKMQQTLDQHTQMLLKIKTDQQAAKLSSFDSALDELRSAYELLHTMITDAKKSYSMTTWLKGEPLPNGYKLVDSDGKVIADDAEIPDGYRIKAPNGEYVTPEKILDPETASGEEMIAYNKAIVQLAKDTNGYNYIFQEQKLKECISAITNQITTSGTGIRDNPINEFDYLCSLKYNFDSQSYLPRVMFRETIFTSLTQAMGMIALVDNVAEFPDSAVYKNLNQKYHAAVKLIDKSIPSGHDASEIKAYPHGQETGAVATGKYIKELKLSGVKGDGDAAKALLETEGYTVIDQDLNEDAGGHYIYLGYKTTDDYAEAIKDLKIVTGKGNNMSSMTLGSRQYKLCPYSGDDAFTQDETGDLNCKAGGTWMWLYYTTDASSDGKAIERVFFDSKSGNRNSANIKNVTDSNGKIWDLNDAAGGDDIYMYQIMDPETPEYISEIMTAAASKEADAKKKLTDKGFTVINQDTNKSAGGDYVYVGYKTTTDPTKAITGLYIRKESKAVSLGNVTNGGVTYSPVTGCVNLNNNSGGKYLYLYYAKDYSETAPLLKSMWFNAKEDGSLQEQDFNQDAGGDDIYLHTTYHSTSEIRTNKLENDPEYHPYCYTLNSRVTLMYSDDYDFYNKKAIHHTFTTDERNSFVNKMTNTSLRDELYSAGLLRDEPMFDKMKNLNLAIDVTPDWKFEANIFNYEGKTYYHAFKTPVTVINCNSSIIENQNGYRALTYSPNDLPVGPILDSYYKYLTKFISFYTYTTDYSATLPVNNDYAQCLGVGYDSDTSELCYYMDIGSDVDRSKAGFTTSSMACAADNEDAVKSYKADNGDDYFVVRFKVSDSKGAETESQNAKFIFDYDGSKSDYIELPKYDPKKYTVSWMNHDKTVLETDEDLEYGTTPEYNGPTPTKEPDNNYVYFFSGWDSDVKAVTGNTFYVAQFEAHQRLNYVTVEAHDVNGYDVPADLTGGGEYEYGDEAKLTAPQIVGYSFVGWYEKVSDSLLSTSNTYSHTVDGPINLIAKYKPMAKVNVQINGGRNYTINGDECSNTYYNQHYLGDRITVVSNEENFAFWQNDYGMVVSRSKEYTFTVTGTDKIIAVTNTVLQTKASIVYESAYNQIIKSVQLKEDQTTDEPDLPSYNGNKAIGWDYDCDGIYDPEKDTLEAAKQSAFNNDNHVIVIKPIYELNNNTYMITVNGGAITSGEANTDGTFTQNTVVAVTADEPIAGQKFSHWRDGAYKVVSYNKTYSFYADRNLTLYAVYVDEDEQVDAVGTTEIINMYKDTENKKLTFVSLSTVPQGCKIDKAGVIATNDASVAANPDTFNVDSSTFVRGDATDSSSHRYTWNKTKVNVGDTWYVRAYLVYTDKDGNTHEILGDIVSQTM
ncbi:MAG: hypothetical protein K6F27_12815 [Ruminococcus sp.]|nr:hypothetical protein [Ruminococcus sp.]